MEETVLLQDSDASLKPVLDLARESANSNVSTIRTVVLKALSDSKIFCGFNDIKSVFYARLDSLGPEGKTILNTLDLFSYGTYNDYSKSPATYISLNDSHLYKLRQLTLLTLVEKKCSEQHQRKSSGRRGCLVPYATLAEELGYLNEKENEASSESTTLSDAVLRQVEELVLSCVYARVVSGQLCQKSSALFVSSRNGPPCRPRDVPLSQGAALLEMLKQFHQGRLDDARRSQRNKEEAVQKKLDAIFQYHTSVVDRAKKAETTGVGSGSNPTFIGGGVRGWPEGQDERRLSVGEAGGSMRGSTSRRQTKRSRGGVGGALDSFGRY